MGAAIQAEMELMQTMMKPTKDADKRQFYNDKHENLENQKNTIIGNIECGIMTPEKYINNVKKYLQEQEGLASQLIQKMGKSNEHVKRVQKRIELMKAELYEAENP